MKQLRLNLKERFRKFIEGLSKDDVVAVMHHTDSDGVCSGVIMAKLVERKRGKKIDFRVNQEASDVAVLGKTIEKLREAKVNKLIITDLGVDQSPENIREVEKFAEILVIDHHKIYNDIGSKRTIFIKPQFISEKNPAAYPASKFCFDLASEIADVSDLDWVAAIGLIGDCAFNSWKEFLGEVFSKYKVEQKQDVFDTDIGRASSLISDAECFDVANVAEEFDVVYSSSGPEDVLGSSLKKYKEVVENEISYWIDHVTEFAEFFDDLGLIFYVIKPKYKIKAPISTILSLKNPSKTIIILQDSGEEKIGISARRRDEKVAVNDLLENAVKSLEGARAGGHVPAAGGKIRKEDLNKFKENLIGLLKNG